MFAVLFNGGNLSVCHDARNRRKCKFAEIVIQYSTGMNGPTNLYCRLDSDEFTLTHLNIRILFGFLKKARHWLKKQVLSFKYYPHPDKWTFYSKPKKC